MVIAGNATVDAPPDLILAANTPSIITPSGAKDRVHHFVWCPSYMWLKPNNAAYTSQRTSTRPFYKGLSERFEFYPNDNSTWIWRRIIIAYKDEIGSLGVQMPKFGSEPNSGDVTYRKMVDIAVASSVQSYNDTYDEIQTVLFEGVKTTDWTNPMLAKLDRSRVTVLSDTRRNLVAQSNAARPQIIKVYTPINKSALYLDEENGTVMTTSPLPSKSKSGLGNIFVMDLFQCPIPINETTSRLQILVNSTLYWHEKA